MKTRVLFLLAIASIISLTTYAQKSIRIGYIDTEYILQNVPEYQDAMAQLESKVGRWNTEIEKRLSEVDQKKKQLTAESVLLTPELIEERQEEISIEETEILDYQQKRFGPNGDLMLQRKQLMEPIQDQIFTAVQEIATARKYDFVFDKSADVVMLYSADRYDISDQVLRSINRTAKRTQAQSRKERKAAEAEEIVPKDTDNSKEARAQALADKKADREKAIEDRRAKQLADREAKKKALEEKKQKIIEAREKARQEKLNARNGNEEKNETKAEVETEKTKTETVKEKVKEVKAAAVKEETKKTEIPKLSPAEAKKKALEDKKKKIIADRQAKLDAQKAKKEAAKKGSGDSKVSDKEARKKALEDKKKKILEARKAKIEAQKREKDSIKNQKNN